MIIRAVKRKTFQKYVMQFDNAAAHGDLLTYTLGVCMIAVYERRSDHHASADQYQLA